MRRSSIEIYKARTQKGYTLIEIAIVMLVVGLIIATAIPIYTLYVEYNRERETLINQKRIDTAITSFKNLRGRYPCPARSDAAPGDEDYGREIKCYGSTVAAGSCVDGICYEESERTFDVDGSPYTPRVERGAVPFATLGIDEMTSYDGYNNRFSYAVTENLTDKAMFRINRGGISVVDGDGTTPNSVIEPPGSAHYFIFSHGPDRIGAYDRTGNQITPCKGPMFDNENCNTDSSHKTARYRVALKSTAEIVDVDGAIAAADPTAFAELNSHFDDYVNFVGIGTNPYWEIAEDTDGNPEDTANLHDSVDDKRVIIGGDAAISDDDVKLQIEGAAKLRDKSTTETICDYAKSNCIDPVLIGAEDPASPERLHCEDGTMIGKGISEGKMNCEKPRFDGCGTGQIMYGVDEHGNALCRDPDANRCAAMDKYLCGVKHTLPDNTKSGSTETLTEGASFTQVWQCNKGSWKKISQSGVCTCTPGSTSTTSNSCGANMTGTVTTTTTTVCPSGEETTTHDRSACTCVSSTNTWTEACPANHTGEIVHEDKVTCVNNTPTYSTGIISNTCACVVNTGTRQIGCKTGWSGKVNQERKSQCPSGAWGGWTDVSNTCTCKASYSQYKACPAEYNAGAITETCSWDCSKGYTSNATLKCVETKNTCSCAPTSSVTFKSCPAGYTGNIKVTSTTTCPGNVTTVKEDDTACQEIRNTCTVDAISATPSYTSDVKAGKKCTETCEYTASADNCTNIKSCYKISGVNSYDYYSAACK